jgi:hypothetical protein
VNTAESNPLHEELAELDKIITRQEAFIVSLKIRKRTLARQLGIRSANGSIAPSKRRLKMREELTPVTREPVMPAGGNGALRGAVL